MKLLRLAGCPESAEKPKKTIYIERNQPLPWPVVPTGGVGRSLNSDPARLMIKDLVIGLDERRSRETRLRTKEIVTICKLWFSSDLACSILGVQCTRNCATGCIVGKRRRGQIRTHRIVVGGGE